MHATERADDGEDVGGTVEIGGRRTQEGGSGSAPQKASGMWQIWH